ncbi:hypothetical protein H4R33_004856 [Dimargaris cristalligena]|uniref:Vacuolar ATPase assembly integral membrane protein VMA21 n=1 Tax=Dimargaris cristalligena TaxID=215637 RepID=A0A4P9ZX69_9FUNG|nr:hypothetical protein H4R33_004856 [Dimargaris cristalligena]RKP37300.1 hypothetical protein BJ085DRAFT_29812 [Dimargaris cristalligena]|eukprot:RKP37300.1 hypothetical protein BJ085DRAFT_29812 [Dimargaris cristalligena]
MTSSSILTTVFPTFDSRLPNEIPLPLSSESESESDEVVAAPRADAENEEEEDVSPPVVIPTDVVVKLVLTTLCMIFLPITGFVLSRDHLFQGNTIYSSILAVVLANLVLVVFIVMAVMDDKKGRAELAATHKKRD